MHLTDQTLDDLEAKILKAEDLCLGAGSDLDGVDALNERDRVRAIIYHHALDLIQMAREVNFWSKPKNKGRLIPMGTNEQAIYDFDMPDFVRAFLAINSLSAMETWPVRTANYMPKLYGRHKGRPVRVVMVSRLGDVGISREDKECGYYERCSIYDVTDYSKEMLPK